MVRALFPGTFDPIHYGHIDIAQRAARLFDEVIMAVYDRPLKSLMFEPDERMALVKLAFQDEPRIRVMGFAGNYANLFDANEKYKSLKEPPAEKDAVKDELWGIEIPFPLPGVGAKLKVTGKYGVNFAKSSTGIEADPMNGIMTYQVGGKWEYVDPPPPWDDKNPFFPQGASKKP